MTGGAGEPPLPEPAVAYDTSTLLDSKGIPQDFWPAGAEMTGNAFIGQAQHLQCRYAQDRDRWLQLYKEGEVDGRRWHDLRTKDSGGKRNPRLGGSRGKWVEANWSAVVTDRLPNWPRA